MPLVVTLHVYSQRRDPSWILADDQAQDFLERVRALEIRTPLKARGFPSRLGYRGFSVTAVPGSLLGGPRLAVRDGIVDPGESQASFFDPDRSVERSLLSTAAGGEVGIAALDVEESLARPADELIQEQAEALVLQPPVPNCTPKAADAPLFDPSAWNVAPFLDDNNCYNYANNQRLMDFSVPGLAHSFKIKNACDSALQGALKDGLLKVNDFSAQLQPGEGWYVALAVRPGHDCHWYRQDANGCWSHKPGVDEATNLDNSKNIITDPSLTSCDRGPYTDFCGFMVTKKGVVIH